MNNKLKNKQILPYVLALAAILIWGHNGYRIVKGLLKSDDIESVQNISTWKPQVINSIMGSKGEAFVYKAQYRDPFKDWLCATEKKKIVPKPKIVKKEEPLPIPPALRLTGILKDKNGQLAIIEGPDGETKFIRKNDEIAGVKITVIDSNWVSCKFGKQEYKLKLRP